MLLLDDGDDGSSQDEILGEIVPENDVFFAESVDEKSVEEHVRTGDTCFLVEEFEPRFGNTVPTNR